MSNAASRYPHPRLGHALLEDQMCTYTGQGMETSPDVLDAVVYGLTDVMMNVAVSANERLEKAKKLQQLMGGASTTPDVTYGPPSQEQQNEMVYHRNGGGSR